MSSGGKTSWASPVHHHEKRVGRLLCWSANDKLTATWLALGCAGSWPIDPSRPARCLRRRRPCTHVEYVADMPLFLADVVIVSFSPALLSLFQRISRCQLPLLLLLTASASLSWQHQFHRGEKNPTLLPLYVHQQLMVMEFFVLFFFTKRQSNQNKCYKHSSF